MKIDISEQFESLPRAPIVEAVIQVHARPDLEWDENKITEILSPKLGEYPKITSQSQISHMLTIDPSHPPKSAVEGGHWHGLLCRSEDGRQSIQINQDGFFFSRLSPYQKWEQFLGEAMRLSHLYFEAARPLEIQRIGLRFLNRIQLPPKELDFEKYIKPYPKPPFNLDLPFMGFFHQDTLGVPGYPYAINIVRTIQPASNAQTEGISLILDIDAFSTQTSAANAGTLEKQLTELRWLKNKTFFGSVTDEALALFK